MDKLLDSALREQRLRLARYDRKLQEFEQRFGTDSATLYTRFEAGEASDAMDYFEWASLYELKQDYPNLTTYPHHLHDGDEDHDIHQ